MSSEKGYQPKRRGRPICNFNKNSQDWFINRKQTKQDACDCPYQNCSGCWYPCETCGSNKCSTFCRTIKRDRQLEWKKSD